MEDQGAGGQSGDGGEGGGEGGSPDMYDVVVNGETKQVGMPDLIKGYQQNDSYTQNSQALAEEKKRYGQTVEERATELYMQAWENAQKNGADGQGQGHEGEEADPSDALQAKIQGLEQQLNQFQQAASEKDTDAELNTIMEGLTQKYPNMDSEKVLVKFYNTAQEHDDINQVFEQLAKESQDAYSQQRQKWQDEYIKSKEVNPFSSGENGNSTEPVKKTAKPVTDWGEARERMEERLKHLRRD